MSQGDVFKAKAGAWHVRDTFPGHRFPSTVTVTPERVTRFHQTHDDEWERRIYMVRNGALRVHVHKGCVHHGDRFTETVWQFDPKANQWRRLRSQTVN